MPQCRLSRRQPALSAVPTRRQPTLSAVPTPRRTVYSVLGAFAVSRAAVILLLIIGSQITFVRKDYGTIWRTELSLSAGRIWPEMARMAMVGDAWFYHRIAMTGYEARNADRAPQ